MPSVDDVYVPVHGKKNSCGLRWRFYHFDEFCVDTVWFGIGEERKSSELNYRNRQLSLNVLYLSVCLSVSLTLSFFFFST